MGAQWKQKWRELNADRKGKMTNKLVKEIEVAARMGGPHPEFNARLAAAVEAAKKQSVYRDTIERAIAKGAGTDAGGSTLEAVVFEGFAPHRVPVIVECLTDNNNRTSPEIRILFRQGSLGTPGSVAWMFDRVGLIEAWTAEAQSIRRLPRSRRARTISKCLALTSARTCRAALRRFGFFRPRPNSMPSARHSRPPAGH